MQSANAKRDPVTGLIVVQPTPLCNIDCNYCYLPDRRSKRRLSLEKVGPLFRNLLSFPTVRDVVSIVWHAGEPMTLPAEYYESAFRIIQNVSPNNLKVRQCFQTNGTLLNEDWCRLISKWEIQVGVSIDGPRHLNDINRLDRAGRSTFDKTIAAIKMLQKHRIPFHVISVLTSDSLNDPDGLFDFYLNNDITHIAFNIEEKEGVNNTTSLNGMEQEYRTFLARFWSRASAHGSKVYLRELENTLQAIRGHASGIARDNKQVTPFGMISVDTDGNLSTFSPELLGMKNAEYSNFLIGNALTETFEQISTSVALNHLKTSIAAGVEKCRQDCSYFGVCGGGAPSNKLFENGTFNSTSTVYCRLTRKAATDVALNLLEQLPFTQGVDDSTSPGLTREGHYGISG